MIVLGDMGELGENEVKYHSELGEYINSHRNLKSGALILSVGELSKHITDEIKNCRSHHFSNLEEASGFIKKNIGHKTKIFLKASRSMKFERLIELLV